MLSATSRRLAVLSALALLVCLAPAADSSDATRGPAGWRSVWSTTLAPGDDWSLLDAYVADVAGHHLAIGRENGDIAVIDVSTGTPVSSASPVPGLGVVRQVWIVGPTLLVRREADPDVDLYSDSVSSVLAAYDLSSGRLLWASDPAPAFEVSPAGVVRLRPSALDVLDVRTGVRRSSVALPPGCTAQAAAADTAVAVLNRCSNGEMRLSALDVPTGRSRWQRVLAYRLPPPKRAKKGMPTTVQTGSDGSVLVRVNQTPLLFAPDGRPLAVPARPLDEGASIEAGGGLLAYTTGILSDRGSGRGYEASYTQAIDPATGLVRWAHKTDLLNSLVADDTMFLALHASRTLTADYAAWPLPAYVVTFQAATGRISNLPLSIPYGRSELIGAGDGMIFVLTQGITAGHERIRLTAHRLVHDERLGNPPEGAVAPSRWPDSCHLLRRVDLDPLGAGYQAVPRPLRLPDGPLPIPAACSWVPPTDDRATVFASVAWVASSPGRARDLFAAETDVKGDEHAAAQARDIVYYEDTTPAGRQYLALINVGPVIVRLMTSTEEALRLLAPRLRDNLGRTRLSLSSRPPVSSSAGAPSR